MSTVLSTPIETVVREVEQDLDLAHIDLKANELAIRITHTKDDGTKVERVHNIQIWDKYGNLKLPVTVAASGRQFIRDLRTAARAQGWMGAGVDTDNL